MARGLRTGRIELSSTPQPISSDDTLQAVDQLILRAGRSNTASFYIVGNSGSDTDGFEVGPGEDFTFENENVSGSTKYDVRLRDVYVEGKDGEFLTWLAWVV